ncbi:hypothetical protein Trydic_g15480 [Trypoxylus dichotomus]
MPEKNIIRGREPMMPLPQRSLGKLLLQSLITRSRNYTAFVNAKTEENLSYGELLDSSLKLAISLKAYGLTSDKIIGIASDNHVKNFIIVLAALYTGIPIAFINPKFTKYELQHILNIVTPEIIFCTTPYSSKLDDLKSQNAFLRKLIIVDSNEHTDGTDNLSNFVNQYYKPLQQLSSFQPVDVDIKEHIAFILFSSGTTGLPKGVMLTHLNVLATLVHSLDCFNIPKDCGVSLFVLPFFHTYGLHWILVALLQGRTIVLLEKFEPEVYLSAIERYRISTLAAAPPLIHFLLKSDIVNRYNLTCVKDIACGGAPLTRDLEEAIKKKFNVPLVRQGFGMTELGCAMAIPEGKERLGSVGVLAPGVSCVVRDINTSENLGPYQRGEICIKGAIIMKGYYKNEKATKEAFTQDGWMKTGDIAYYDEDGYFFIVDRIKELIKYKGFQIAPAELEQILLTNPKIQDAGVIGVPDEDCGEIPLAFIVKQPSATLNEGEVKEHLAKFVSKNKYLYGGVRFIQEIPRTPSGKILRKELKKLLKPVPSKL